MTDKIVFSIIETPGFPKLTALYKRLNFQEIILTSIRKAISELKNTQPDFVIAEFFYGYGSNYAGVNVSNLDVLFYSMQKYAPDANKIVFVKKAERKFVDKLNDIIPLDAILTYPIYEQQIEKILSNG